MLLDFEIQLISQKHGIKTTFCCDKCNFKSHLPKDLRLHRQSVHQITKRKASNSELKTTKIPRIEASKTYKTTEIDIKEYFIEEIVDNEASIVNETVISENSTISLLSIKPKNENVSFVTYVTFKSKKTKLNL